MDDESKLIVNHDGQTLNKVYRSYFRAARWSRLALVVFWVLTGVFILWALPWDPFGMQTSDYSPAVVLTLVLLGFLPACVAIALLSRSIAKDRREALAAWSSIYDRATGLRKSDYFMERLKLQCQLGKELAEYRIGVILIVVEESHREQKGMGPVSERVFRMIGMHVANQMRPTDLVAPINDREIGVLVSAASTSALEIVGERIRRSIDNRLDDVNTGEKWDLIIQMGLASLDDSASDPDSIIAAARRSLKVIRIDGRRVAA